MDINYLLQREQIERMRADRAACGNARIAHLGLADAYRAQVQEHRDSAGRRLSIRRRAPAKR